MKIQRDSDREKEEKKNSELIPFILSTWLVLNSKMDYNFNSVASILFLRSIVLLSFRCFYFSAKRQIELQIVSEKREKEKMNGQNSWKSQTNDFWLQPTIK